MPALLAEWVTFLTFAGQVAGGAAAGAAVWFVARGWVLNRRDRRATEQRLVQLMRGGRG